MMIDGMTMAEKAVLRQLVTQAEVQVQQVVGRLDMPQSTVSGILTRLVKRGLVDLGEPVISGRGRPGCTYRLRLTGPVAVIELDGTRLIGSIVQPDLTVAAIDRVDLVPIRHLDQALDLTNQMLNRLAPRVEGGRKALVGVAMAINGAQFRRGFLSSVLPWANEKIDQEFAKALKLPLRVMLPMKSLAEYQLLREPLPQTLAYLEIGDGVGTQVVVKGQIYQGDESLAGELGHVRFKKDGPRCGCGRRGCLEALCSGPAIVRRIITGLKEGASSEIDAGALEAASTHAGIEQIWRAWNNGDNLVHEVMEEVFDELAWAVGLLINLFDPGRLPVGGYVLEGKPEWLREIDRRVRTWILHEDKRRTRLEPARATLADQHTVIARNFCFHEVVDQPVTLSVNVRKGPFFVRAGKGVGAASD